MERRSFLRWSAAIGAAGAAAAAGIAGYARWREIAPALHDPGRAEGHFLRDRHALPRPTEEVAADVVVLGSGIAGLTAAWKLKREGIEDVLLVEGPETFGNAAGGRYGDLAYPTGAHYLPIPPQECLHVRHLLYDLGVIRRDPFGPKPEYDERLLLHAPHERLLYQGHWHEGILPRAGVPAQEQAEHARFFAETEKLRTQRGADRRKVFTLPAAHASTDPAWRQLDTITFKAWLDKNGYRAPTLLWYLDYCCRDDYGTGIDRVSAWAGLHYFCARGGEAANADNGAWLTWPGGLQPLATRLAERAGARRIPGTVASVKQAGKGVEALCFTLEGGKPRTYLVRARKAICAMPLFVASRVVENIVQYGFDPARHMPAYAPWLVTNFLLDRFPDELPEAPLSWDNVVHGTQGLGYVVSTHQDIRQAPPPRTVFTSYVALADRDALAARRWMQGASAEELLARALEDLRAAYGRAFDDCVVRADITLRAHAMAAPLPGFLSNQGVQALRDVDGPILFAHADLSGFSVFEEASWWGWQAARAALG
ncbi:flavin-dependent amine oxidoreductase [Pseudoduganella flava]|uniref:Flavin-dependent amine oxidoreductase n=1 Tax=Pseudoduganella flava TaxID=871742 RepID=A0A562PN47_9BURK|nr:FAD-dependent oxidoreductase [Pseudoduganella flava]QGZ40451.1 NAD(P)-binding protein [Pseudoduganella flava]TWI45891.1 flavin-dependent amine oxidoreductase [Pseudoduganella flava]